MRLEGAKTKQMSSLRGSERLGLLSRPRIFELLVALEFRWELGHRPVRTLRCCGASVASRAVSPHRLGVSSPFRPFARLFALSQVPHVHSN